MPAYAINRRKRARAMQPCSVSAEHKCEVVGWHLGDIDQRELGAARQLLDVIDIAHAPSGISLPQAGVKGGIAVGHMLAAALEWAVQK